jgi:hypothetical protein
VEGEELRNEILTIFSTPIADIKKQTAKNNKIHRFLCICLLMAFGITQFFKLLTPNEGLLDVKGTKN